MKLLADRWSSDYSAPEWLGHIGEVADLTADWRNPGGLQQVGFTVRQPGRSAYLAYSNWDGDRLIIHAAGFPDQPIFDATIVKPALLYGRVAIVAQGPHAGCLYDDYEANRPGASDNSDDTIKTALTNHAPKISADQSHIDSTAAPTAGLDMPIEGLHPGRLIEDLLRAGDGNGAQVLFWLQPAAFDRNGKPQKPIPYLKVIADSDPIDWQIYNLDIVRGSRVMERDIADRATSVAARYSNRDSTLGGPVGTISYELSDTAFHDTGRGWDSPNVSTTVGYAMCQIEITNSDDTTCRAYLGGVVAGTSSRRIYCYKDRAMGEAGFNGADPSGKTPSSYRITRVDSQALTAYATNNTAQYGTRKRVVSARGITSAAGAAEIRDTELARLSNAQLRYSITIGSRQVMDGNGQRWPLLRMFITGGYLRDNDLGADAGLIDTNYDYLRAGRITSMRYDHRSRQLMVAMGEQLTLDAVLSKFGYNWQVEQQLKQTLAPLWG